MRTGLTVNGKRILGQIVGSDTEKIRFLRQLAADQRSSRGFNHDPLFRSEFIYLEKDRYPTEEEQFQIYKQAAEAMAGRRVIIRTLDIVKRSSLRSSSSFCLIFISASVCPSGST